MRSLAALLLAGLVFTTGCAGASGDPGPDADPTTNQDESEFKQAEAKNAAPIGRETMQKLRALAPALTLGFLGEDSGEPCTASFRIGPAKALSREEALRLFGFDVQAQIASDDFAFNPVDPKDAQFWASFEDSQDDDGKAKAHDLQALFSGPNVTALATMIVHDRTSFSDPAFFVARMKDGSLVALRGQIGGQTL